MNSNTNSNEAPSSRARTRPVHPKIMNTDSSYLPENLDTELENLRQVINRDDSAGCIEILKRLIPTYKHQGGEGGAEKA